MFQLKLAQAIYIQGDGNRYDEALSLFRAARAHAGNGKEWYWCGKCTVYAALCLRKSGELQHAKQELETVSFTKAIAFGPRSRFRNWALKSLWWNVLCDVYTALDDCDNEEVATRKTVQALLDKRNRSGARTGTTCGGLRGPWRRPTRMPRRSRSPANSSAVSKTPAGSGICAS